MVLGELWSKKLYENKTSAFKGVGFLSCFKL